MRRTSLAALSVAVLLIASGGVAAAAPLTAEAAPAALVNDLSNPSAELGKTTGCPTATTKGSGGVAWTECPTFWFTAGYGGGVNTSVYEWANEGHTGARSLKINGTGFGSNCYIGAKQSGETRPPCGTAAWNYTTKPVTAGAHYLYTSWYKADAGTEIDATIEYADGSFSYAYLGTVTPSSSWSPLRFEYDVPSANAKGSPATKMSVYHIVYQNTTLFIDDMSWGPYTASPFTRGMVSVTLDDGFTNQFTNALPILNKYDVKSTFYVISGKMSEQTESAYPGQVAMAKASGHDIQSHTVSHSNLTKLTPEQLDNELKNSQQILTNSFDTPVGDLAAPYGAINDVTVAAAQKYYQSMRGTDPGFNSQDYLDPYRLRVQNVRNNTTLAQVQSWIARAEQDRTWLILVYHAVSDALTGTYVSRVADFDQQIQAISNSSLASKTVNDALHEAAPQAGVTLKDIPAIDPEMVANNSVEFTDTFNANNKPLAWYTGSWGNNTNSFSWVTGGRTGQRALRTDITKWSTGQAKWFHSIVGVRSGARYEFSVWYKSNISSVVSVAYMKPDGTTVTDGQDYAVPASTTWTQYKIGVVLPTGATGAYFAHGIGGIGWLITDDYSMKLSTVDAGFSQGIISLTFDDGSPSIYTAVGVVDTYGWKTTQYIPTAGLNKWTWTDAQILSLDTRGHEIAAHTKSHPDLTKVSASKLKDELCGSKAVLEKIVKHPVPSFSTPYGSYDARVIQAIKDCGFTNHRTVNEGLNTRYDLNPYNIVVRNMLATTTMADFNTWVEQAKAGRYHLVIVYHEVMDGSTGDPGLDRYTTTPELFKKQMDSIQASGLAVKTVKDAMAELVPQKVRW